MTAVKTIEHEQTQAIAPADLTPMGMLDRAISQGAGLEVVEKLMALQERWEANQGRKAFDQAVADAKAEIPVIKKNRDGHNSKYADFAAYARVVDPILSRFGLSYRFRTNQDDRIHVTCILSHRDGHSEENTLAGPPDNSGSKNAIQAIGSTVSYLQRYTLVQALGLAAERDDDGKSADPVETISEEQLMDLETALDQPGQDKAAFMKFMKIERLEDLPVEKFKLAMAQIQIRSRANG